MLRPDALWVVLAFKEWFILPNLLSNGVQTTYIKPNDVLYKRCLD